MDELSLVERDKYSRMWGHQSYRAHSPGLRIYQQFTALVPKEERTTLIDFGVGSGKAAVALQGAGFAVTGVDITENCLDANLRESVNFLQASLWELPPDLSADYGYCTDVMEHIPRGKVEDVLREIHRTTRIGCFFQIACFMDGCGRVIGETLHLTVEDHAWWKEKLEAVWPSVQMFGEARRPQYWCKK